MENLWKAVSCSCKKNIKTEKTYLFFLSIAFTASLVFTYYYFLYTHEYQPGSSSKISSFNADKVFQTRLLIPLLSSILSPIIPLIALLFQWIIPYPIDYEVVLQMINVVALTVLIAALPSLIGMLGCTTSYWTSLFLMIPITWNYIFINGYIDGAGLYYSYDIPSLTFFVLCLILFLKKRWILFYPIWLLACLNRESACFVSLGAFLLLCDCSDLNPKNLIKRNKHLLYHILFQACIWLLLRAILCYAFRNNPGQFFESPHSMMEFITKIWTGESHWAMQNPRWFLSLFGCIWIFPVIMFKYLNSLGRRFATVGLIYLIILIFRSNMMETRVYNELNVIVIVCFIICITNFARKRKFFKV